MTPSLFSRLLLTKPCWNIGAFSSIFKHFQAFSSIFAVAQRAFTVGFEILKCSYLKILKNVSFGSLDLIVACSSMVLWVVNEKKESHIKSPFELFGAVWSCLETGNTYKISIFGLKNNMVSEISLLRRAPERSEGASRLTRKGLITARAQRAPIKASARAQRGCEPTHPKGLITS